MKKRWYAYQVEPRGTSSRCAICGSPVERPVRRKAVCEKGGRVWHADANAAVNMLLQGPSKGHGAEATPRRPQADGRFRKKSGTFNVIPAAYQGSK